ncbi:RNA-binding S4 domain protein [Ferroglobus placidus DSM 10642]|uniref:RNA-binding S4 domain protein n=1 Tax=Ferroglobus placidus (strain DSM 10642 / AEDII12DO) TaxID=589924 RepID=D3RZ24_FERPA|nr:S4 domain-containing protein [Ferroglobus placidus]ADC65737.1 RNA-binding S4 domain protein [Ferroglobus placidus DSM 10642]
MRLDEFLKKSGYFKSRSQAKEAIKRGFVKVNGKVITKPSFQVKGSEKIEVAEKGKPRGYYKLKELDKKYGIVEEGDIVLDLGSSAGGFLLYASEKAKLVYGIEYSKEFEDSLREIEEERKNIRVFIDDAFTFDTSRLDELDVILCDLTLEPEDSLKALMRFVEKLKKGGKVLFVSKERIPEFPEIFEVEAVEKAKDRREYYIILRKLR